MRNDFCRFPNTMHMKRTLILHDIGLCVFFALCTGVLFAQTDTVSDSQIASKWYAFAIGMAAMLIVSSVVQPATYNRFLKISELFSLIIVITCSIQALFGTLQYGGLIPTLGKFRVTGSFDNPAGFAAALCAGLPFTLLFWRNHSRVLRYLARTAVVVLVVGIVLSGSRAGLLSVGIVGLRYGMSAIHKASIRRTIWGFLPILLIGLYLLKKDSADGRLLIWRCTAAMVIDRPFFGYGPGGFTAEYMNYQANYFRTHPDSPYARLADSVQHPFNEYLFVVVDYGLSGFATLVVLGYFVVRRYRKSDTKDPTVRAAGTCLLSIGVFALFSYPLLYPFTWVAGLFSLWIIFGSPWPRRWVGRTIAISLAVGLGIWVVKNWRLQQAWYQADSLAAQGNPSMSLPKYRELYPKFVRNRYFLYNFVYVLNEAGEYAESLSVANVCRQLWADYYVELLRGEAALRLERYSEAEQAFSQAGAMCPNRFMPLYRLAEIYMVTGRETEARDLAERILAKEVKIPSATVTAIKSKMRELINMRTKK